MNPIHLWWYHLAEKGRNTILLKGMLPALLCLIPRCSKPHWCSVYGTLFTYICRISHAKAKFQGPKIITSTNTYQETASHSETHLFESLLGASCAAHKPCNKKHPVASHPLVQFPGSDEDPRCICSTRLSLLLLSFLQLATEPYSLRIQKDNNVLDSEWWANECVAYND